MEDNEWQDKSTLASSRKKGSMLDGSTSPQDWPLYKKLYVSSVAWMFTFTVLNSLTSYAAAVVPVTEVYGVSMEDSILGFSLFLIGIAFAPLHTPHLSERVGRNVVYYSSIIGMSIFLLGAAYSKTFTQLAVLRFFAGFFGGPTVVNVEGTFADVWDANYTVSYYSFLGAAQYLGASVGPIICGPVIGATGDWRYSQFIPLIFALAALLFGVGVPETYPREIARRRARALKIPANLEPAPTGVQISQILRYTVFDPAIMLVSEPLVALSALSLMANFGLLFSLFIVAPAVLASIYSLDAYHQGIAFLSGLAGSLAALISAPILEQLARVIFKNFGLTTKDGEAELEFRLVPAVIGNLFMIAAAFWIGNTASPAFSETVPVAGTAFYVWGSLMHVISFVSYFFDAYPVPQSILSALTAMAVTRVLSGGIVSIFFLFAVLNLGGVWAFQIFGIIFCVLLVWPTLLLAFGPFLRSKSRFSKNAAMAKKTMAPDMEHGRS